jgi:CelD/BcsL family acetyltransferase involved in cellulose biosynthesis
MSDRAVEIVHASALTSADQAAWRTLQDATPAFGSPLLGPDFALAVGAVRKDARVAIWRAPDGEPRAFFAYHHRPQGFGRPIGAPFCDYHAVVSGDGLSLDATAILSATKLKALRLSGLIDPFGSLTGADLTQQTAYRIVLQPGDAGPAHLDGLKASSANRFKNFRRYSKRLEQAFGPVRLVPDTLDVTAFERLLAWKRLQLARTGLHDFLRPAWVAGLMRRLFETSAADSEWRFGGLMINLYAGDHPVAGHFGVRLGGWYHPWIGATAPNLEAHGAGFVHQWKAVEAMGSLGLHTYDLGPGSDHWKRLFTADVVEVATGLITAPTLGGRLARAGDRLWTTPPLDRIGLTGRLRNRLDQIAAIETAWSARAQGVLAMAAALERRAAARRPQAADPVFEPAETPTQPLEGRTP